MKGSILPASLRAEIAALTAAAAAGRDVGPLLATYIAAIAGLAPETVAKVSQEVRLAGRLWPRPERRTLRDILSGAGIPTRQVELAALERTPRLAALYVFHGDGWIREAALSAWPDPPASALELAAIVLRLNDWVGPVRQSATACAQRLFPRTRAAVVAAAAPDLLERMGRLGRWGQRERDVLEDALFRVDVVEALVLTLSGQPRGRISVVLRQLLRRPAIDPHLPQLVRQAAVPVVRAIALEALSLHRARWPVGTRFEWIDKRYGIGRHVPVHAERPVTHALDVAALLAAAADDPAVVVRRAVCRILIAKRNEATAPLRQIGRRLAVDRAASVRARAGFYLRDLGEV
jgi:hypothetical protein